jgi:hypothetical protein
MIWFRCKSCGKSHGRGENLAGTMVFCDCGTGNRVPWSSTAPEPPVEAAEVPAARPVPPREDEPARRPPPPPPPDRRPPLRPRLGRDEDDDRDDWRPPPGPRRFREARRPNPNYCLNHDETPSAARCDDCRCSFCAACVVTLQGKTLCGPCKNFRLRAMSRPARVTALAVVALVVGLLGGPVTFCLSMFGYSAYTAAQGSAGLTVLFGVIGMVLPAAALVLAVLALREMETKVRAGGRSLALTGAATAAVSLLWDLAVTVLVLMKQVG